MMRLHIFSIGLSVFTCASAHEEMQYIASVNKLYQEKINKFSCPYGTSPLSTFGLSLVLPMTSRKV